MEISLSQEITQLVQTQIDLGAYAAPDELIGDALRHFLADETQRGAYQQEQSILAVLEARWHAAQKDPSRLIDGKAAFAEIDAAIDNA